MNGSQGWSPRYAQPRQKKIGRRVLLVLVAAYALSVVVGSGIGWLRLMDLRSEFMDGRDNASCRVISHDGWRELDCGGYYDAILAKRDAKAHQMGCVVLFRWHVENNNSPHAFNVYLDGTFCWRPTLTL